MRRSASTVPRGRVRRRLEAGACLTVLVALAGCAPLGPSELRRQADGVAAVSSEGALLAHEVALDRTQDNFVRVHAGELGAQMDHTIEKLRETEQENEVPADLRGPTNRTVGLAQDAADALQQLQFNPGDAGLARVVERKLDDTAGSATSVGSHL